MDLQGHTAALDLDLEGGEVEARVADALARLQVVGVLVDGAGNLRRQETIEYAMKPINHQGCYSIYKETLQTHKGTLEYTRNIC